MTPDRIYSAGEPLACGDRIILPVYYSATFCGPNFGYRQIVPWVLLIIEDNTVSFVSLGDKITEGDLFSILTGLFDIPGPACE